MKRKLRVGVLTFHNGPNYGGFLQAWHLVHAIRNMGHECHVVNYLHPKHHASNRIHIPLKSIASLKEKIFWAMKKRGFNGLYDSLSRHEFTEDSTQVPWNDFDCFVVGSDIVWDYQQPAFGHDPVYFGMLPQMGARPVISYAASCGPASPKGPFPEYIPEGLKRFSAIGVRDDTSADLVKNASSRESTWVVDPTWLGADPTINWKKQPKGKYLFVYGHGMNQSLGAILSAYCKEKGLKLVSALSPCPQADIRYHSLTPFQWAQLFKNAESTMILGTLHGTLFSIKYGKPFVLVNSPAINPKIRKILEHTGHACRLFEPGTITKEDLRLLDPAEFQPPSIPAEWLNESLGFLKDSLGDAAAKIGLSSDAT